MQETSRIFVNFIITQRFLVLKKANITIFEIIPDFSPFNINFQAISLYQINAEAYFFTKLADFDFFKMEVT